MAADMCYEGGNAWRMIENSIRSGRLSHACIFECGSGTDRMQLAVRLAKAVLCEKEPGKGCGECVTCRKIEHNNHEDVCYIETNDKGNIRTEEVEEIQEVLRRKPLSGSRNIAFVTKADRMVAEAQNKLLKTLEEPSGEALIVLMCDNMLSLLPTIRSRCAKFSFVQNTGAECAESISDAESMVKMLAARKPFYEISMAVNELLKGNDKEESRQKAQQILDAMERIYGDMACGRTERICSKDEIYRAVDVIERIRADLKLNINPEHVLKHIALIIGGNI